MFASERSATTGGPSAGTARLYFMDVEEGRDDDAVAGEKGRVLGDALLELLGEHAVHRQRQLGLDGLAVAVELLPVALDQQGAELGRARTTAGLRRAGRHGGEQLLVGEAQPARLLRSLLHEALQAARRAPLPGRRLVDHEGAAPLPALQVAVLQEIGKGAGGRVPVDPEKARQLPHRGQLHARLEAPRLYQMAHLGRELHVHRHAALPVHLKPRRRGDARGRSRHRAGALRRPDAWAEPGSAYGRPASARSGSRPARAKPAGPDAHPSANPRGSASRPRPAPRRASDAPNIPSTYVFISLLLLGPGSDWLMS